MKYLLSSHTNNVSYQIRIFKERGVIMRSSKKQYEDVANHCSAYHKTKGSELSNCVRDDCNSCLNCAHFANDEHCKLDLFDDISKSLTSKKDY